MSYTRIHWARILLGGLLAEVALILAIVPLGLRFGDNFLHYTAPPGSFVMCFLGALWVCRRIESHFILHGTLVGVVAAETFPDFGVLGGRRATQKLSKRVAGDWFRTRMPACSSDPVARAERVQKTE